jgi:hypothetical protein
MKLHPCLVVTTHLSGLDEVEDDERILSDLNLRDNNS